MARLIFIFTSPSSLHPTPHTMTDNSSQLTAIKNIYRDMVINLLCEAASRGEKSVSVSALQKARDDTNAIIIALNITPQERDALTKLAEQEAQQMFMEENSRRQNASSGSKPASNAAPTAAQHAPTKSDREVPIEINLPEPADEFDFVSPPHFSASNPLHTSLKEHDQSYRCTICGELYTTPVAVMPCLHVFCSECIRKHCKFSMGNMKRECRCPECNQFVSFSLVWPCILHHILCVHSSPHFDDVI